MMTAGACQTDRDDAPRAATERRALPPLDTLAGDLDSFDPARMRHALVHLTGAVDLPHADNPQRPAHRDLLARAAVDLWLYTRVAETMADAAIEPDIRQRWLDERGTFGELLELALAAPGASSATPHADLALGARLAARLRPWLRPALRDPQRARRARATLTLLDAARADDERGTLRAAANLRLAPDAPMALHANLLLALRASAALDTLRARPAAEHPDILARATGQFCPDGIAALDDVSGPAHATELLRRRCGFACTDADSLLGLDTPTTLAPLPRDLDRTCPLDTLAPGTPGQHQAFDNFLATHALSELARLRDALRDTTTADTALQRVVAPFAQSFADRVEATVVPGTLPFLDAEGPDGVRLPLQRWATHPIEPTPAVALVSDGALHLSAWPRYAATADAARAHSLVMAPELAFPGAQLASLRRAAPQEATVDALRQRLRHIDALPWPSPPGHNPDVALEATITVVADASTPVADLRHASDLLARAGFVRITLATWPGGVDGLLARPVPSGLTLRIDTPLRPAPRLRLADHHSTLFDTLGRPRELPIFEVRRFLPDIYAAVLAFASANPAIDELVLDPDPELDLETLVMALDALQYQRDGDVMASTEHLLAAPPFLPVRPLMRPIYLAD